MDPQRIAALLRTESDRVEWKASSLDHADPIVRAACALANDLGATGELGYVLVGVDPSGAVVGIDAKRSDDEAQQRLANKLRDIELVPPPSVTLSVFEAEPGKRLLVLEVAPYPVPPAVQYRGVVYVRVGTTTRRATQADLSRLRERRPEESQPFDLRTIKGASLDDLELSNLRAQYEDERSDDEDEASFPDLEGWLVQRDLGRRTGGAFVPTVTGLLVHGKSPQDWLRGAYVDVVRYSGSTIDAPVGFRFEATGRLPDQLEALGKQLRERVVKVPAQKVGIVEAFVDEYPLSVLEELVRNLIQHRNYELANAPARVEWFDDRIELSNPGGPFGHASAGAFGEHSDYRNPTLTRALVELGYVQKLGRGVRRARVALEKNGNPPLEVETDGFTRVIVRARS